MWNINAASNNKLSLGALFFKSAIWITIICLALLFLPKPVLIKLFLHGFVVTNNNLIGLIFVTSSAYIVCYLLNIILEELIVLLLKQKKVNTIKTKIKFMDLAERSLLREFFLQGVSVLTVPKNLDVVTSLSKANIIEPMNTSLQKNSVNQKTAKYKISDTARKHLNRQVLGLPNGNLTDYDIQRLKKTRPKYINYLKKTRDYAA